MTRFLQAFALFWVGRAGVDASITQGVDGGFGYIADTDVSNILKLALDIRDMRTAATLVEKKQIYESGANGKPLSLAALSLNSTNYEDVPIYNTYRYAFYEIGMMLEGDQAGYFDRRPAEQYANTMVEDLFLLNRTRIEGDGALALNVAMAYWANLWKVLQACEQKQSSSMTAALDTAAALWIGDGQERASNTKGFMLYNLAERASSMYLQDESNGESLVNRLVLENLISIKGDTKSGTCTQGETGYLRIREKVKTLIKLTNIVLVQMLLHHIVVTPDSDYIELYSLALYPQISACNPSVADFLLQNAVTNDLTDNEKKQEVIEALQSAYSCLLISCGDVGSYSGGRIAQCQDASEMSLAGYKATSNIREKSFIDRDIKLIRMYMRLNAYSAVKDIYNYGWNTYFSLRQLATNGLNLPVKSVEWQRFQMYYQDDNFVDNLISNVIEQRQPFVTASVEDRTNLMTGILEGIVMYLSVTAHLESAVPSCENKDSAAALEYWDGGAAFFVGSMEGEAGNNEPGLMLYGLARSLCADFETCNGEDASVNQALIDYLMFGRNTLSSGACQQAQSIINNNIKPFLLIPLVQATLMFTAVTADGTIDGGAGALHAFARAILPAVNQVSPENANIINSNTNFYPGRKPNVEVVFGAFRKALALMDTDCSRIGALNSNGVKRGVCVDDVPIGSPNQAPSASQAGDPSPTPVYVPPPDPNGIAWGRYQFVDEAAADNDSLFSLDVRDMYLSSTVQAASTIYGTPSKNAQGGVTGGGIEMQSLADFSTNAVSIMSEDPLYNFYRVSFYDDSDFDETVDGYRNFPFGDTVVRLALDPAKGNSVELASNAAVVMNVFMLLAHQLYESVRLCKQQTDSAAQIDSAVALWIGQEQGQGIFDSGWMMYAQAQKAIKSYGLDEGEAPANTELMNLFNTAQGTAKSCPGQPSVFRSLRKTTDEIIRVMSKILLQRMLYFISEDDRNNVELFSLSFVPLSMSCDQEAYEHLRDSLFLDFDRTGSLDDGLVPQLGKVLHCLRYTCADLGDTTNASLELQTLVSSLCAEIDTRSASKTLAGYQADVDVSELSRIDLDVLQIELFMRTRSYSLAADYYMNGRNSLDSTGAPISLQSLALDESRKDAGDTYTLYQTYFQSDNYTDYLIQSAIEGHQHGEGIFSGASRSQLTEAVSRLLQTMVPYLQITARLRDAMTKCATSQGGKNLMDEAAALFVGSIEGMSIGGDSSRGGKMMFALGKEMCSKFDKCENPGDASVNEFVLISFRDIKRSIDSGDCASAQTMLDDVLEILPVPFIQGTLSMAVNNFELQARSQDPNLAAGYIFANSILPLVKAANQTSAATIDSNMEFNLDKKPVVDGPAAVFDAFHGALPSMGINCHYIGTLESESFSVCDGTPSPVNVDTATSLGEDIYVTTTNVQDRADIALDVKAMTDALLVGREALARIIYKEGENSPIYDEHGARVDLRTLSRFSTLANETMKDNPLFQIAVYALQDSKGLYLGEDATEYADTIVQEAMSTGAPNKSPIAAEAAVSLNLWMELANELFQTLSRCRSGKLVDDDGVRSIDEAAAYWIGDGQMQGDAERGHLLYALAEEMGDVFGVNISGKSKTNLNMLRLFHQAKIELSVPGACTDSSFATYRRLRHIVHRMVSQMMIVNIQALIHNIRMDDQQRVRIYAHAVVPLVVGCSSSSYEYLREKLIDFSYSSTEVESIISSIESTLSCFDLSCDDIGTHKAETTPSCVNPQGAAALAGYKPAVEVSDIAAKIDLDIQEMDILIQIGAKGLAEDLYTYGKHITIDGEIDRTALSLESLATSPGRSSVPQFSKFTDYFGSDERYSDTIVRYAMMSTNSLTADQRRLTILGTSQYSILYMASLQAMEESAAACEKGEASGAQSWDKAAAWLIGHLEGTSAAGSSEGRLLWGLAKEHCNEFDTCSKTVPGSATVNDEILLRFFTGRGAVLAKNCGELRNTISEISSLLPIPLIQAALSTAVQLQNSRGERQLELLAKGYIYSTAILPLIKAVNQEAATAISRGFDLVGGKVLPDGLKSVVTAYSNALSGLGIDCEQVGSSEIVDVCTGSVRNTRGGLIAGLVIGFSLLLTVGYLVWTKRKKPESEDKPIFTKSKGELNHASDLILSEHSENSDGDDTPESETGTDSHHEDADDASISSHEYEDAAAAAAAAGIQVV